MLHKIFSVYDSKTEAYLPPFYTHSVGQAERSFKDACNDTNHEFHKHAEDFTLFQLGEFDDATGHFSMLKAPFSLGLAVQFRKLTTGAAAIAA